MTVEAILDRLAPTFAQEGIAFEIVGQQDQRLLVRARRVAPGVPVAFLVKALEGTLRRYHADLSEVELVEYDPGEGPATPAHPSEQFDKVLKHRASPSAMAFPEVPGLDLRGCDRAQAVRALEQAHKLWSAQGISRFRVRGVNADPVARALQKWVVHYDATESTEVVDDEARVVLKGAPAGGFDGQETLWFPARLMVIDYAE